MEEQVKYEGRPFEVGAEYMVTISGHGTIKSKSELRKVMEMVGIK